MDEWQQYRIAILQNIERIDGEVEALRKGAENQRIINTDQKWTNRMLVLVGSIGGGASVELIFKLLTP